MPSKNISAKTFTSRNEGRGFHGVMELEYGTRKADDYFSYTVSFIKARLNVSAEQAIEYLDSRRGRHFGDQVADIAARDDVTSIYEAIGKAANRKAPKDWNREIPGATA